MALVKHEALIGVMQLEWTKFCINVFV